MTPSERHVSAWVKAVVNAQAEGEPLHGAQVSETTYGAVEKDRCIQIGPVTGATPRPVAGGEEVDEFDSEVVLILLSKVKAAVDGGTLTDVDYASARDDAVNMALALALAAFDDNSLGGAVRDSMPDDVPRDFTTIAKAPYAVANLKLLLNPSGDK